MRSLPSRSSDWVLVHQVEWIAGSGVVLAVLGSALALARIEIIAAGAVIGLRNNMHARNGALPASDRTGFSTGYQPSYHSA